MLSKNTHIVTALKPWIPLILLLAALISSVSIYAFRTEQYKDWKATPGIVLENRQYISRVSGRSHRIYYSYTIDGKTYTGSDSYHGFNSDFEEGDSTEVWYNPDDPSESSFHKPAPLIDPYVPLFLALPLALLSYFKGRSNGMSPSS